MKKATMKKVTKVLTELNATMLTLEHGGKHMKMKVKLPNKEVATLTLSCTPKGGEDMTVKNVKKNVKTLLNKMAA